MFYRHNTESIIHTLEELDRYKIEAINSNVILAQMYGMRNDITFNLEDVNVAQFIPYGKKFYFLIWLEEE